MDAFCLCFEDQKPLVGLGLAPQGGCPLQEPSLLRLAIFLDHLLDPRALFCRLGRLDGFHSISVPRTDTANCARLHSLDWLVGRYWIVLRSPDVAIESAAREAR